MLVLVWGAGMTGGLAYLLEEDEGYVKARMNMEIVVMQRVQTKAGENQLKELIEEHVKVRTCVHMHGYANVCRCMVMPMCAHAWLCPCVHMHGYTSP